MKKLIGIILALCMLTTMASAAVIEDAAATSTGTTVTVTYTALADNAQATLFAYKVADTATVEDETTLVYKNQTDTPIVGIDQKASDGSFEFKLADGFTGKVVIKVGGTDVATPDTVLLLDFFEADEPIKTIEIMYGDSDGDTTLEASDGNAIVAYLRQRGDAKRAEVNANYGTKLGVSYETADGTKVFLGDSDGDGTLEASDGNAIVAYLRQRGDAKRTEVNANYGTKLGSKVEVIDNTSNN